MLGFGQVRRKVSCLIHPHIPLSLHMITIYKLTFPTGLIYVGRTSQTVEDRLAAHFKKPVGKITRAIKGLSPADIKTEILCTEREWYMGYVREIQYIKRLNALNPSIGLNISRGGWYDKTHKPGWKPKRRKAIV